MHSEESNILLINKKLVVTFQTDVYLCLCSQNNLKLMSVRQWQVQGIKTTVPSSGSLLVPPTAGWGLAQLPGRTPPLLRVKPWPTGVSVSAER